MQSVSKNKRCQKKAHTFQNIGSTINQRIPIDVELTLIACGGDILKIVALLFFVTPHLRFLGGKLRPPLN